MSGPRTGEVCVLCKQKYHPTSKGWRVVRRNGKSLSAGYYRPRWNAYEISRLPDGKEAVVCVNHRACDGRAAENIFRLENSPLTGLGEKTTPPDFSFLPKPERKKKNGK